MYYLKLNSYGEFLVSTSSIHEQHVNQDLLHKVERIPQLTSDHGQSAAIPFASYFFVYRLC